MNNTKHRMIVLYAIMAAAFFLIFALPIHAEMNNDGKTMTGASVVGNSNRIAIIEGSYSTGTPIYVETDPVWLADKASYSTGTPVYVESDPFSLHVNGDNAMAADLNIGGNTISNGTLDAGMFPDCTNFYYVSKCGDDANSGLNEEIGRAHV